METAAILFLLLVFGGYTFYFGTELFSDRIKVKNKAYRNYFLSSGKSLRKKSKDLKQEKETLEESLVDVKKSMNDLNNGTILQRMKERVKALKKDSKSTIITAIIAGLISIPCILNWPFFLGASTALLRALGLLAVLIPPSTTIASTFAHLLTGAKIIKTNKAIDEYEYELSRNKEIIPVEKPVPAMAPQKTQTKERTVQKTNTVDLNDDVYNMSLEEVNFEMGLAQNVDGMLRGQYDQTTDIKTKQLLEKRIVANYYRYQKLAAQSEYLRNNPAMNLSRGANNR